MKFQQNRRLINFKKIELNIGNWISYRYISGKSMLDVAVRDKINEL